MSKEKSPAFQFYPKDFLADGNVSAMSLQECGAYIRLLCQCWKEDSLPADPQRLANMVGVSGAAFRKLWPMLSMCFVETDGRLRHPRLDIERQKQRDFKEQQRRRGLASGAARANQDATGSEPESNRTPNRMATGDPTEIERDDQPEVNGIGNGNRTLSSSDLSSFKKEREKGSLSKADPFTEAEITERAARFIERYQQTYQARRHGARYAQRPARDYAAAVTLCQTWTDDERLDKLAEIFLTTDHKFAEEGSRTIPQFLALASWADGRLAEWESQNGKVSGKVTHES